MSAPPVVRFLPSADLYASCPYPVLVFVSGLLSNSYFWCAFHRQRVTFNNSFCVFMFTSGGTTFGTSVLGGLTVIHVVFAIFLDNLGHVFVYVGFGGLQDLGGRGVFSIEHTSCVGTFVRGLGNVLGGGAYYNHLTSLHLIGHFGGHFKDGGQTYTIIGGSVVTVVGHFGHVFCTLLPYFTTSGGNSVFLQGWF